MEPTGKRDHGVALGRGARDLHRILDRFGPGGEEDCFVGAEAGRELVELLGKRDVMLVSHNLERGMREAFELVSNSCHHLWMTMAGIEDADATGEIDVAFALGVPKFGIFRLYREDFRGRAHAARHGGLATRP